MSNTNQSLLSIPYTAFAQQCHLFSSVFLFNSSVSHYTTSSHHIQYSIFPVSQNIPSILYKNDRHKYNRSLASTIHSKLIILLVHPKIYKKKGWSCIIFQLRPIRLKNAEKDSVKMQDVITASALQQQDCKSRNICSSQKINPSLCSTKST